jgi:hypothetical protein
LHETSQRASTLQWTIVVINGNDLPPNGVDGWERIGVFISSRRDRPQFLSNIKGESKCRD